MIENSKNIIDINVANINTSKKLFNICNNILDVINMALQGNNFEKAKKTLFLCKYGLDLYEQTLNKAVETLDKEKKKEN